MELNVRGWGRNTKKEPKILKDVDLTEKAQLGGTMSYLDTRVRAVPGVMHPSGRSNPVSRVEIDFGIDLTKFGGSYLARLELTPDDIALLYHLCFGDQTVSRTRRKIDQAVEAIEAMKKRK